MLKKERNKEEIQRKNMSFVFIMLLAASLIGIGSATYHQPEVASAQPQPQSPNTALPTFGSEKELDP